MGKYIILGAMVFMLGACGGKGESTDNGTNKDSGGKTTVESKTFSGAFDNMGRLVLKEFEGYRLEVVVDRVLTETEKTSKETLALYGEINQKNTGALLKINSHYRPSDTVKVKVYQKNTLLLTPKATFESEGILFFGQVTPH